MPAIAFIATSRRADRFLQDPSFRYRCENLALALQDKGRRARLVHAHGMAPRTAGQIAVFHRPTASPRLDWLLWRLRRRGVMLVADFDDLVFDPAYARFSPAVLNDILPLHKVRRAFAASRRVLERFDLVTVSTQPLRGHVLQLVPGQRVKIVPNAVHHSWLKMPLPGPQERTRRLLTYFPGTLSHDRDFLGIAPALEQLLARHPSLRLQITGRLRATLDVAPDRLARHDRVDFADYAAQVQRGWLNLAPLEDTPFHRCKSALKVIEAGWWGIPTVCSPVPDMARFRAAGALPVEGGMTWVETIERLLDPAVYRAETAQLRDRILALADPALMAEAFLAAIG